MDVDGTLCDLYICALKYRGKKRCLRRTEYTFYMIYFCGEEIKPIISYPCLKLSTLMITLHVN